VAKRKKDAGDDVWKWLAGAGAVYGVYKHLEAEKQAKAAHEATARAEEAVRHAATAESRVQKLAIEIAHTANVRIAQLHRADAPPLRFEGCLVAATNGVLICIDMTWLLTGVVDPARERGSIWGRVVGALSHEWYHFLDMGRGTRASHAEELSADAFAGRQLARLHVAAEPFAELLSRFPQSLTHPAGFVRAKTMLAAYADEKRKRGLSHHG
jgi:hypothetical protein